ncbi:DnaB helicase C-terminal domain-containing protein [Streptomyces sp. ASQP_92]|uniref:DnaB helicase C-terminal domain-containing protein n=1 Tax=Streptomyces sp. ASQP_92 TaxID=2979116 RepID=UPI0021C12012|nr:DnaB helicase C-terminal domain-containing protein [Streptomyces sp. ASQP_92]MCT9093923.1 DnaB helicase C-terminal domain-containing protein [Streptomyces sp. ASQP_92]
MKQLPKGPSAREAASPSSGIARERDVQTTSPTAVHQAGLARDQMRETMTKSPEPGGILTGLSDFDALAGAMPRGLVTVVAARSSSGTTAFALGVARHNAEAGHQVIFASFEGGTDTIMSNLVAATTSVNVDRPLSINRGRRARIDDARAAMERSRLRMWSNQLKGGRWPFSNLSKDLTSLPDLDLLVMDGYGIASFQEPSDGATLTALHHLAQERNCAVLVTAHLVQNVGAPDTETPSLAELGVLDGAVAGVETILLLHRPDRDGNAPERRGEVDLIALRGWETTGTATVRFEPEYHRLADLPNT